MRLAIVGSRTAGDEHMPLLAAEVAKLGRPELIVSGGARGADTLARRYAEEHGIELLEFLPDWDRLGKSAGFARNVRIAEAADVVLALWDGASRGTQHTLRCARERGKRVVVVSIS